MLLHDDTIFEGASFSVRVEVFQYYSVLSSDKVKDSGGNLYNSWILSATSCSFRPINVRYYIEMDASSRLVQNANSIAGNGIFVQIVFPETNWPWTEHSVLYTVVDAEKYGAE